MLVGLSPCLPQCKTFSTQPPPISPIASRKRQLLTCPPSRTLGSLAPMESSRFRRAPIILFGKIHGRLPDSTRLRPHDFCGINMAFLDTNECRSSRQTDSTSGKLNLFPISLSLSNINLTIYNIIELCRIPSNKAFCHHRGFDYLLSSLLSLRTPTP